VSEYPLELFEGHIIIEVAGLKVLVDTGAPRSIGREQTWEFLGMPFALQSSYMGLTIETLSDLVGTHIDVLLGAEILARQPFLIDTDTKVVSFGPCPTEPQDVQVRLTATKGIPTAPVVLDGQELRMFVDTGAKLSYLHSENARQYPAECQEQDFYPGFGKFKTDVRQVRVTLGGESIALKFGVLPKLLETSLTLTGVRGIIGTELLEVYRVCIDMAAGRMRLWEPTPSSRPTT